jgi:hypothetical protein
MMATTSKVEDLRRQVAAWGFAGAEVRESTG